MIECKHCGGDWHHCLGRHTTDWPFIKLVVPVLLAIAVIVVSVLASGCGDNVLEPLPACAEIGCRGLAATCKPGHCACAPAREDTPEACVAYPACSELACSELACEEGPLCTCRTESGPTTCED